MYRFSNSLYFIHPLLADSIIITISVKDSKNILPKRKPISPKIYYYWSISHLTTTGLTITLEYQKKIIQLIKFKNINNQQQ